LEPLVPAFVDCHSHVVPSGDDGAGTLGEGDALCRDAAAHGTRLLFATPHVWPHLTLTEPRERRIRAAFAELCGRGAGVELRLGWELTPTAELLDEDPHRYAVEGTDWVLMEVPFRGSADTLVALAELTESAGLRPLVAHPERTEAVLDRPVLADELAERGWTLQVNSTSLLGEHGEGPADLGWDLVERGVATVVGSDGHRPTRPARLDAAYAAAVRRLGPERAQPVFDGSALGLATPSRTASRAALRADAETPARSA
jgi:protein-tyrosine phosphatase